MEGEQRRAKTGFNATTDILIIDKMLTQLYNKSYFTRLCEWMNALTHCIAGVLELCTIEVYMAFKTGTSTQNDVTRRLFSKSSETFGTCTVRFFTRNTDKVLGKTTLQWRCQWEPMRAAWIVNIKVKNMNLSNHPKELFILTSLGTLWKKWVFLLPMSVMLFFL